VPVTVHLAPVLPGHRVAGEGEQSNLSIRLVAQSTFRQGYSVGPEPLHVVVHLLPVGGVESRTGNAAVDEVPERSRTERIGSLAVSIQVHDGSLEEVIAQGRR